MLLAEVLFGSGEFMKLRSGLTGEVLDEWSEVPRQCGMQLDGNSCGVFVAMVCLQTCFINELKI